MYLLNTVFFARLKKGCIGARNIKNNTAIFFCVQGINERNLSYDRTVVVKVF